MLSFFDKNAKDRARSRHATVASGGRVSAIGAAQVISDSIPTSGTMTQQELNEVHVTKRIVTDVSC